MARDLLTIPPQPLVWNDTRRETLLIRKPVIFRDKFVSTMELAMKRILAPFHLWNLDQSCGWLAGRVCVERGQLPSRKASSSTSGHFESVTFFPSSPLIVLLPTARSRYALYAGELTMGFCWNLTSDLKLPTLCRLCWRWGWFRCCFRFWWSMSFWLRKDVICWGCVSFSWGLLDEGNVGIANSGASRLGWLPL